MQNVLHMFAIQPVWGPCCYPPLVGMYVKFTIPGHAGPYKMTGQSAAADASRNIEFLFTLSSCQLGKNNMFDCFDFF